MKTSDLLPGLVVAVRISRFSVRRAVILGTGWRDVKWVMPGTPRFRPDGRDVAIAYWPDKPSLTLDLGSGPSEQPVYSNPDVIRPANVLSSWEQWVTAEAEREAAAAVVRNDARARQHIVDDRCAAVERILEPLGIDAQRYSSEGGFRLSLDVMEHLCTLLQK